MTSSAPPASFPLPHLLFLHDGFHIFFSQLEKVYDPRNAEDDMIEMEEERLRMREHVMNEVCFKVRVWVISVIHQVLALILITRWKSKYTVGFFIFTYFYV